MAAQGTPQPGYRTRLLSRDDVAEGTRIKAGQPLLRNPASQER